MASPSHGLVSKRGSDDITPSGAMADNASKKSRPEFPPSAILFARNLPSTPREELEVELTKACQAFGTVAKVFILRNKNQAFVEMSDVASGTKLFDAFNTSDTGMVIAGSQVAFEYSNGEAYKKHQEREGVHRPFVPSADGSDRAEAPPNNILLVTVSLLKCPMTVDTMHQVFSPYGAVEKIVTFTKNEAFKAFVQFKELASARQAVQLLDQQCIFDGCNLMHIQFSTLIRLEVKFNNDRSRDYTQPNTVSAGSSRAEVSVSQRPGLLGRGAPELPSGYPPPPQGGYPAGAYALPPGHAPPPPYGAPPPPASSGAPMGYPHESHVGGGSHSPVCLVSGMSTNVTPDMLFNLFGVYGDVVRVKVLYNKRDTALVQMSDGQQAKCAMDFLNRVSLFGHILRVNESKYQQVSIPQIALAKADEAGAEPQCSKDYTRSSLHRYRKSSSHQRTLYPPYNVLHLSNIPPDLSENDTALPAIFAEFGEVAKFNFFDHDRRMALVTFKELDNAVGALVSMHNKKVGKEGMSIRVNFSKRRDQDGGVLVGGGDAHQKTSGRHPSHHDQHRHRHHSQQPPPQTQHHVQQHQQQQHHAPLSTASHHGAPSHWAEAPPVPQGHPQHPHPGYGAAGQYSQAYQGYAPTGYPPPAYPSAAYPQGQYPHQDPGSGEDLLNLIALAANSGSTPTRYISGLDVAYPLKSG